MKFVLWLVGLFALAVGLSLFAQVNTGYAILVLPPYRVELSLNMAVVILILAIVVAYGVLRGLAVAFRLPEEVKRFQRQKKLTAARHALRDASLAYLEGRYQKAEREAVKSLDDEESAESRALALLLAAQAAHRTKDYARRDSHFAALDQLPSSVQLARHMQEAELYFDEKRLNSALQAVTVAREISPSLTAALKLEMKIRLLQNAPDLALPLIEKLQKSEGITQEQAQRYRRAAWLLQLEGFLDLAELQQWWQKLPTTERMHHEILLPVVRRYAQFEEVDTAAELLVAALDQQWSTELLEELVEVAAELSETSRLSLVKRAEAWLEEHRRDYRLLLLLGWLALAQQLWGKAQSYFEASLSVEPSLAAHAALAQMFESLDRPDDAERHYQASVELALAMGNATH